MSVQPSACSAPGSGENLSQCRRKNASNWRCHASSAIASHRSPIRGSRNKPPGPPRGDAGTSAICAVRGNGVGDVARVKCAIGGLGKDSRTPDCLALSAATGINPATTESLARVGEAAAARRKKGRRAGDRRTARTVWTTSSPRRGEWEQGVNGRERILRGRRRAAQDRRGNLEPSCKARAAELGRPPEISSQEASSQEGEPPQQNGGVEPVPANGARRVNVKYR